MPFRNCTLCDTHLMQSPLQSPTAATDPKSVKVHLTSGAGMDIEWVDGHNSHYNFVFLRDACPCAMCEEERGKAGRRPGDPAIAAQGTLLIFKPTAKPVSAEGVGNMPSSSRGMITMIWAFTRGSSCAKCVRVRNARNPGPGSVALEMRLTQ